MKLSDEELMAYLDNELAPEERARVAEMVASDPEAKARLERQERLHASLNAAFDPVVAQKVPERLVSAAMTTPISPRWRLRNAMSRMFSGSGGAPAFVPRYALAAATLVLGLGLGWALAPSGTSYIDETGAGLVAQGDLADALDRRLASDTTVAGPRVGLSFRTAQGTLCRTFETGSPSENVAGIACHDAGSWKIDTLARTEPRGAAPYEVAGAAMPTTIRNAVNQLIDGAPFDAEQERRARDAGW